MAERTTLRSLIQGIAGAIAGAQQEIERQQILNLGSLLNIGEHQVVLQYTVYHVGFSRKPPWLE
ncbi:hypothetical protein [Brevundimonas sp.]|uniref:hypothetical protein n=1 Tax=Brevundimonas sp. TaxID=1871086 RepID=UPI002FC5973B